MPNRAVLANFESVSTYPVLPQLVFHPRSSFHKNQLPKLSSLSQRHLPITSSPLIPKIVHPQKTTALHTRQRLSKLTSEDLPEFAKQSPRVYDRKFPTQQQRLRAAAPWRRASTPGNWCRWGSAAAVLLNYAWAEQHIGAYFFCLSLYVPVQRIHRAYIDYVYASFCSLSLLSLFIEQIKQVARLCFFPLPLQSSTQDCYRQFWKIGNARERAKRSAGEIMRRRGKKKMCCRGAIVHTRIIYRLRNCTENV